VTVGLVWAQAAGGVIGADGRLPWHLPEDLARFKSLTMGETVVMGRATWESLPDAVRPLPGRHNVVLTRRLHWHPGGAAVARSIEEALDTPDDVWVIGGESVYRAALPFADVLVVTEIAEEFAGDTHAPEIGPRFRVRSVEPEDGWLTSRTGLHYRVVTWERAGAADAPSPGR
jgi:dihydrofolate reductase